MLAGVFTGSALLGVLFVAGIVAFTWWIGGILDDAEEALFGDQTAVPEEMKPAGVKPDAGGGQERPASFGTHKQTGSVLTSERGAPTA